MESAPEMSAEALAAAAGVDLSEAPSEKLPPGEWAKKNLFDGAVNSVVTILVGLFGLWVIFKGLQWVYGADFEIIRVNLRTFMVGLFPRDELWRLWASGYVVLLALGLTSGGLAHNAYDVSVSQDLPAAKEPLRSLLKRFWAILAVIAFFLSFARSVQPFIWLPLAIILLVAAREFGWRMPAAVRARIVFIGAALFVISMLVLAGTSSLGGLALGLIALLWMLNEMSQLDVPAGIAGTAMRYGIPLVVAVIVYVVELVIPYDGFGWEEWGGLHITLFVTVIGITLGMPFGILLALGRKSNLPVIKTASVMFIEFIRGVPLISLLLFSNLMLPLFWPGQGRPADLTLAMIVITGFSAAYIAEIVRGGLQAVPQGQTEAAQAGGMSAGSVQRLIVLPQALRAVIPAMVGQFIALFKDTSLLSIIGITEFLRVSDTSNAQPTFAGKGLFSVTYLFVGLGYWAFAYTMSKESRRLETKLGVGTR